MKKSKMIVFVTGLYAIAEAFLYSVISITGKSFHFQKWVHDYSEIFAGVSIIMLLGWIIVSGLIFFNEIKTSK